jgi:ABC-type uncharacterized transport system involved in gliding motility auxiliary subunit
MDSRSKKQSRTQKWSWLLAVVGIILILGFFLYASFVDTLSTTWTSLGVTGAVLLGVWVWLERKTLKQQTQNQHGQKNSTAVLIVLLALGAAITTNALAIRYNTNFDLSLDQRFTLSDQSQSVLASIAKPVTIKGFFVSDSPDKLQFTQLIQSAQTYSNNLDVEIIDPRKEPLKAQQFEVESTYGTIIIQSGNNHRRLEENFGEEVFINALVQVISSTKHTICFSQGLGEPLLNDTLMPENMGIVEKRLVAQNYQTKSLNLLTVESIPTECEVLVIAGPQRDIPLRFEQQLASHLQQGNHAFLLLDPILQKSFSKHLMQYGISVGDDFILEQNPKYQIQGGDISYVVLDSDSFLPHEMIRMKNSSLLLQGVRSVQAVNAGETINSIELAHTTENSWAEKDYQSDIPTPTEGVDLIKRVPVMVLSSISNSTPDSQKEDSNTDSSSQLFVFGTSTLVINEFVGAGTANGDFFLNAIAYLVKEDAQINERAQDDAVATISMNLVQGILLWFICLIISPGAVLIGAIGAWREKRAN